MCSMGGSESIMVIFMVIPFQERGEGDSPWVKV
jgi:hypothetical protein